MKTGEELFGILNITRFQVANIWGFLVFNMVVLSEGINLSFKFIDYLILTYLRALI